MTMDDRIAELKRLSCDEQFAIAEALAGNVGYELRRAAEYQAIDLGKCDCQHPETTLSGFAAISVDCPIHGDA